MPNKDNWKKRFDDEFAVNNCNCGSFFAWADYDGYTPDEIKHFIQKELETARQEERERIRQALNIVWVCMHCARLFGKEYYEGKTNIYTAKHDHCDACNQVSQCMHINSYDEVTQHNN